MNPIAPENVLFFVSLVAGLLLMIVNAMGGISHDADHDVGNVEHVEHAADGDSDHGGLFGRALSMLGIGRAPLLLVLTIFFTLFGVAGIFLNLVFGRYLPPWIFGWGTHVAALVTAVLATGRAASAVSRLMPTTESYDVSRNDLVGAIGRAVVTVDDRPGGAAQVHDGRGDLFKVAARTAKNDVIHPGDEVVIMSYDEDGGYYVVTKLDLKKEGLE